MFVTFVIPVFGTEAFLPRCLDALFRQTDGDFEVVVVDDCSPEEEGRGKSVKEIVARYDARFRQVRQPWNMSAYQARNRGVREATGEYVAFCDPDDYVLPDLVSRLKAIAVAEHPDMIVYNCERDCGGVISAHWCNCADGRIRPETALVMMVSKRLQWNVWTKAIRRERCLKALGLQPYASNAYINSSDDFCLLIPALLQCQSIRTADFAGYRYCENANSVTSSQRSLKGLFRALIQTMKAHGIVRRYVREQGCSPEVVGSVDKIAGMIVRWFLVEMKSALKKRIRR